MTDFQILTLIATGVLNFCLCIFMIIGYFASGEIEFKMLERKKKIKEKLDRIQKVISE
jgi:F0F1-type ATP synthase membrane subunit b/b'